MYLVSVAEETSLRHAVIAVSTKPFAEGFTSTWNNYQKYHCSSEQLPKVL